MEKDKEKAREGLLDRMSDTSTIEVYEASEEELKEAQEKADRYIEEAMERVLKEGDKKDKVEKSIEGEEDRESEEDEIEKNLQLLLDNDSLDDDFKASPVTSSSLTKNSLSEISNIFGIVYVSEVFFADTESATCLLSFCLSSHTFAYAGLVRFTGILYTTPLPL